MPEVAADLGSVALLPWVITSFLLTSGVATIVSGRLIDTIGVRTMFRIAVIVFAGAGVLALAVAAPAAAQTDIEQIGYASPAITADYGWNEQGLVATQAAAEGVGAEVLIAEGLGYPVVIRPAYTMGGTGGGLVRLVRGASGGVEAEEAYFTKDMKNHHGGMILLDGYLYGANGGNSGGALVCLEFKTGKVMWDQRESAGRRAKGSLALADGRLYYRMEDGTLLLIEPDPKQYIERGRFEQPDRRKPPAWAHPVIANGKLYVRDQDILFCYDVKEK